MRNRELEFLLVRTRNGHWTFPKGGVDEDATNAEAAAREAYEEAGVKGRVEHTPFISDSGIASPSGFVRIGKWFWSMLICAR